MKTMQKKIGVISLGCDKNRVDTEKMLGILSEKYEIVNDVEQAEIIVINTCAFLNSAREEAINEILSTAEYKKKGKLQKLIVTGCLPQRFINEIFDELKEVDGFLGVDDYNYILTLIERLYNGERVNAVGIPKNEKYSKRILTTKGYAYLKIADGCSNHCTYCLIPSIRGKFRSYPTADLVEEVKALGEVKELILVAQDLTRYGEDLTPKTSLVELIRTLSTLQNVQGIRLLYCYPEGITDELIHEFTCNAKLIKYIDVPFQHASDKMLKLMNRKGSNEYYLSLINKLRERVNGIAIRSTFITGFPKESEEDFEILTEFIKNAKLENAGFFKYSKEEGTASFNIEGHLPESVKNKRLKKLYSVQKQVVKQRNKSLLGRIFAVRTEGFDCQSFLYYGRAYFNAPDIDGKVYFYNKEELDFNQTVNVKITSFNGYDLYGEKI